MRILFVNHTGAWSGAEVALLLLARTLSAEHEVVVACPPDGPLAAAVDRAGVRRLDLPAFEASLRPSPRTVVELGRLVVAAVALVRIEGRVRPDVVHANTPRAGLVAALARWLGGPPVVVRAHDHLPLTRMGRLVRAVLLHVAAAVVAVSESTARRFDEGLGRRAAECVHNAIDLGRFDPDTVAPSPVRAALGIPAGAPLLGQVAQITPWKGQDVAIRALAALRAAGLDAHLLVVGDVAFAGKGVRHDNPGFRRALSALAERLGVADAVHFLGARDDVPGLLAAMDLSLLPSWEEPFALAILESMAMGTPPLATAVGGAPELIEDRVTGRLLDPRRAEVWAAAARELLEDDARRERMGTLARATASRFRLDAHARAMLSLYERVLRPGAPRWLS